MKDYTTNNYCDFMWIIDLLQLKKNEHNSFTYEQTVKEKSNIICINNVIIFGTIVEVKQIGCKGYLYQIDDGTGVIACKHSEAQFEELINAIESEQSGNLNETLECQQNWEQSVLTDTSANDSVFNDRIIQEDEINVNRRNRLKGLKSIWDDIYESFNSLIVEYSVGDSVIIQGKLYNYFGTNQIYINCIRAIDINEEIMLLTVKLEDSPSSSIKAKSSNSQPHVENRLSGLVTFDNVQQPNPSYFVPRNIGTPDVKDVTDSIRIVTPNLESTITFDTFASNRVKTESKNEVIQKCKTCQDKEKEIEQVESKNKR